MTLNSWVILAFGWTFVSSLFAQAPTQLAAFPTNIGTYSGNTPTYKDHPDFSCSVSPSVDSILCVSGESVDLYTRTGKRIKTLPVGKWMSSKLPGVQAARVNDPRVIFDPFIDPEGTHGRHVFVCPCGSTSGDPWPYPIVGISDTADPAGSWHAGQIGTRDFGDLVLIPGFDRNGLYVTYVDSSRNYANNVIAVWKNSSLGKEIPAPFQIFDSTNDAPSFGTYPVLDYDTEKPLTSPMYFISACERPDNTAQCQNSVRKLKLTLNALTWNTTGTSVKLSKTTIATSDMYYGRPANAIQPGGFGIRVNESHLSGMSVQGRNGHLYTSAPTSMKSENGVPVAGTNGFYAYEIDPVKPSIVRQFQVGGNTTSQPFEALFPSTMTDAKGNVFWTFSMVSPSQFVTPAVIYLPVNESSPRGPYPLNASAAVTSFRGACPNNDPPGMMGNYSSILRDPSNPNDVWVFGAYGAYSTPCKWATEAVRITLGDAGHTDDRKR